MTVLMVDTRTCNLRSVANALRVVGARVDAVTSAEDLEAASAIILPGVGAFEPAINSLRASRIDQVILRRVRDDRIPLLGICLGMQLLATRSEENGDHCGLDLIAGSVRRLQPGNTSYRVPNIGWCDVTPTKSGRLFAKEGGAEGFYFVHSYYFDCEQTYNGCPIPS
jgi:imidazole glycerol-phosphate synthase subunit HisH